MNTSTFDSIRSLLAKERDFAASAVEETRQSLAALQSDLHRIDAAMAALDGETISTKPLKEKTRASQPSIGKPEVIQHMEALLERQSPLTVADLNELVGAMAKSGGYSRLGIGMRIKDALKDSRFTVTPDGVALTI